MMKCSLHIARLLPLFGVLLLYTGNLHAQNEIVPSNSANLLRKVWMIRGGVIGGDQVGYAAGPVGDLNGDSIMDFGWYLRSSGKWWIHLGSRDTISTTPYQILDTLGAVPFHPTYGNFYGDGKTYVMFPDGYISDSLKGWVSAEFPLFGISGDTINPSPVDVLEPTRTVWPDMTGTPDEVWAIDLDGDGDDELVAVADVVTRGGKRDARAEVWIYEGGPDFQLDTPTVVLKDTEENITDYNLSIGDLDHDSYPDLIMAANYYTPELELVNKIKFWWGSNNLSNWSANPDRTIVLDNLDVYPNMSFAIPFLPLFDTDGDSVSEFLLPGIDGDWYFYNMNAPGKDPHTRPFTLADADKSYRQFNKPYKVGYLNDSARRYEMMGRTGGDPWGGARLVVLSGGKDGPNLTYDGYYSSVADGMTDGNVFGVGGIVENCEGTGWDCYLTGNPGWHGNDQGIVILLAGGPYIPNDDPSSGAREVSTEEHGAALHVWPNPVREELHVAWRGDLKHPPSMLQVYDMNSKLIVEGGVESWRGEAIWKCGSVASGGYVLVVRDSEDRVIASTSIIKIP